MGKPSPVIYEAAARLLDMPPSDLVAVGDSLEHDIGGECDYRLGQLEEDGHKAQRTGSSVSSGRTVLVLYSTLSSASTPFSLITQIQYHFVINCSASTVPIDGEPRTQAWDYCMLS